MKWCTLFFFFGAMALPAQSTPHSFSVGILSLVELEQQGAYGEALEQIELMRNQTEEVAEGTVLDLFASRLKRKQVEAVELDAAMKSLALNRTGTLEEARDTLRNSSLAGREYLRSIVRSGGEREVEEAARMLTELNDRHAASLMMVRLSSYIDWSVFLVPLLAELPHQMTPEMLDKLVSQAQYNNKLHPDIIRLVFLGTEAYVQPPGMAKTSRKTTEPVKVAWASIQTQFPRTVQDSLARLLVRLLDPKTEIDEAIRERARDILVGSELPMSYALVLQKMNQELPVEEMAGWAEMLKEMSDGFDVRALEELAKLAAKPSPHQLEAAGLMIEAISAIAQASEPHARARQRIPAEVKTLPTRLDAGQQEAVIRAALSVLEHHGLSEDTEAKLMVARMEELLLLSRFTIFPDRFISEMMRDHNRPITDRYVQLAARMPDRFREINPSYEGHFMQFMLRWAESRANKAESAAALKASTALLLKSDLPSMSASLMGRWLGVERGPFALWMENILEKKAGDLEPGIVRSLISHVAGKGAQADGAAALLVLHLERLAWKPEKASSTLRAGQSRLDRLRYRLPPELFSELSKALVTHRFVLGERVDGNSGADRLRSRIDMILVDARLPHTVTQLVDGINSDPAREETPTYLDLLIKLGPAMNDEVDEGRQSHFVHSMVRYVEQVASEDDSKKVPSELAKASKVLQVATFPRTAEWLSSRYADLKNPAAIAWGAEAMKVASDLTGRASLAKLADIVKNEGPYQLPMGSTFLHGLDQRAGSSDATQLDRSIDADLHERISLGLIYLHITLYQEMAKDPDSKVLNTLRRESQRVERYLTTSRLSPIPRLLVSEMGRDPGALRTEALVKLLSDANLPWDQLDSRDSDALLKTLIEFAKIRVDTPEAKNVLSRAAQGLSQCGIPAMPAKMASSLRGLEPGELSNWLAKALRGVPHAWDEDALNAVCGLVESGAKNEVLGLRVLTDQLEKIAGRDSLENLTVMLTPAVQGAVERAMRASIKRQLAQTDLLSPEMNIEFTRAKNVIANGNLPGSSENLAREFAADPAGKAADTWLELLSRHPGRLRTLEERTQASVCSALLKYVPGRDTREAERAMRLMRVERLKPLLGTVKDELAKKPESAMSVMLIEVLTQNEGHLAALSSSHRDQMAEGLLAVLEGQPDDSSLYGKVSRLLSGSMPSALPKKLFEKLSKETDDAKFALYNKLLRSLAVQVDKSTFNQLSKLAEAEGPRQAGLKQTVSWLKSRMVPSLQ